MSKPVAAPISASQRHQREVREQLDEVVNSAQEPLIKCRAVFPFNLFPDTITVDRAQVMITSRRFFGVGDVTSIRIEDILNVTATVGPFFGSLKIMTRFFDTNKPHVITYLWRREALQLKGLILGLVIATQKDIDLGALGSSELLAKLTQLGENPPEETP